MKIRSIKIPTIIVSLFTCLTLLFTGCSCNEKLDPYTYVANEEDIIKQDDNKINMYVFWAKGCGHCAKYINWLNTLDKATRDKFNFYTFEIVHVEGEENLFFKEFAKATNNDWEKIGTPFIVIGNESFTSGFVPGLTDSVIKELNEQLSKPKEERFDYYFDVVLANREK